VPPGAGKYRRATLFRPRKQLEPCGPVSTQLEEIVVVYEASGLQCVNQLRECALAHNWTDRDQLPFDAKLVGRETKGVINQLTREFDAFERVAQHKQRRRVAGK
jgi:hypothetical protein